jgi:hypothetical protein
MWEERFVDESHGEQRVIVVLNPDTQEDVDKLNAMAAKGELMMPRGEEDRYHVKIKPGEWRWIGPREQVDAGYVDLISTLRVIRPATEESPGAEDVAPAIFLLPRFYGEVVGESGLTELADQARILLGDEALMRVLSEPAQTLVTVLATIDIDSAQSEEDKATAPGGDK